MRLCYEQQEEAGEAAQTAGCLPGTENHLTQHYVKLGMVMRL